MNTRIKLLNLFFVVLLQEKLATLNHVVRMADFAMEMKQKLCDINIHSFNNFQIKVGKCFY